MTGVEILATHQVAIDFQCDIRYFWLGAIVGAILGFIVCVASIVGDFGWSSALIGGVIAAAIVGLALGVVAYAAFEQPTEYETQYKVTIDESVSMQEFLDHYEIIQFEGKILTVREKTE